VSRVSIVKRIKIGGLFSILRNAKGNYDWNAIAKDDTMSSGTWAALAVE
jgi:hypothetical protein